MTVSFLSFTLEVRRQFRHCNMNIADSILVLSEGMDTKFPPEKSLWSIYMYALIGMLPFSQLVPVTSYSMTMPNLLMALSCTLYARYSVLQKRLLLDVHNKSRIMMSIEIKGANKYT